MRRLTALALLAATLAGCAQLPNLGDSGATTAPTPATYPKLAPITGLIATGTTVRNDPYLTQAAASVAAREAQLRQRAAALAGPVLDAATLARLDAALARNPG